MSKITQFRHLTLCLLGAVALGGLAGCSDASEPDASPEQVSDRTLAQALGDAEGLSTVAQGLESAGLVETFGGPGSYTIFAPTNDAFAKLDDASALLEEEQRPILVATLRDHIVPGHLTLAAIRDAAKLNGGQTEMRTLGEGTLTFAVDGNTVSVTGPSGETAEIAGEGIETGNGVAIPVSGLLKLPELIQTES